MYQEPSRRQKLLWAGSKALGLSPLDERVQALSELQLEWAVLMNDPDRRKKIMEEENTLRDGEAALLSEWLRSHVFRG